MFYGAAAYRALLRRLVRCLHRLLGRSFRFDSVLARPSIIDPSHTTMGCDLISRTEQIHRWVFKCPTGQLFATFLSYGLPARTPIIHPSQLLGAVIIGLWALNMGPQLLSSSVLRSGTSN